MTQEFKTELRYLAVGEETLERSLVLDKDVTRLFYALHLWQW